MQEKYIYIRASDTTNKVRPKILQPTRQHTSHHEDSRLKLEGPGRYETNQNDIEYRLKKQADHQRKMKCMEIPLAGFSSNVPRFT